MSRSKHGTTHNFGGTFILVHGKMQLTVLDDVILGALAHMYCLGKAITTCAYPELHA